MAGSRLEKFGTIFTRMGDLIRGGVVKAKDVPVWYDVYAAFPPKKDPLYVKPMAKRYGKVTVTVPEIFYKEDEVRAKFYAVYGTGPRAFELSKPNFISTCQRFVEKYGELEKQGEVPEEALFEETGRALLAEGVMLRRRGGPSVSGKVLYGGGATGLSIAIMDISLIVLSLIWRELHINITVGFLYC
ncbi:small ribosomal subunit protein mS23 isoform X1 [Paramormyrops kingsleyae]|uniref:small ribosomal subunit protein mS23 isoform X1 n=1 Tax=Paramormyrops kingsleyae TaxID=1676925 RepID=UPI003B97794F